MLKNREKSFLFKCTTEMLPIRVTEYRRLGQPWSGVSVTSRFCAAIQQRWICSLCLVAKQPATRFHYIYSAVLLLPRADHVLFSVTFRFPFLFLVGPFLRSTTIQDHRTNDMIKEFFHLFDAVFFFLIQDFLKKCLKYSKRLRMLTLISLTIFSRTKNVS